MKFYTYNLASEVFKRVTKILYFVVLISLSVAAINHSEAATKVKKKETAAKSGPIQTSLVVDGSTGKILHEENAREIIYPASLTKVMTLYLAFEALDSGKLNFNQKLPVSKFATSTIPLKLHLKPGEQITVKDSILGIIVKSANDASIVMAEKIAGSEERFAKLMTARARQLGMKNTTFMNSHGLHHPQQRTTAVDLAKLAIAIKRDFPQYYHFFSKTNFVFRGKTVNGHNRVTAMYPGAEGMKTGYTIPAGCNLITTATRSDKSLVGVVTGSARGASRDKKMMSLLDKHFGVKSSIKTGDDKAKIKKVRKVSKKVNKKKSGGHKRFNTAYK